MQNSGEERVALDARLDAAPGITLRVIVGLADAEAIWREFEQYADCTVFQLFDWLLHWRAHVGKYRQTIPVIVLAFSADAEILMLLPLAIEKRAGLRYLTWLGAELCDYNAPL